MPHAFLRRLPVSGPVLPLLLCLVLALALTGCGSKKPATTTPPVYRGKNDIRDLHTFPQDLTAYLGRDRNKPILTGDEAAGAYAHFRRTLFSSWHMAKPSIEAKEVSALLRRKARGWKDGSTRWKDSEWAAMRANARMATYPSVNRPGITIRATNLREMPTNEPRFTKATPDPLINPFDYFQYSSLPVGLPVLLCHRSQDGRWYYVETAVACGWVDARDLAPVTDSFIDRWEGSALAAIVRERVALGNTGLVANIGTVLPMAGVNAVMVPVKRADGTAGMQKAEVAAGTVEAMPLTMTPARVAELGNLMMGQDYGWGGMLGLRDCSGMTRELMAPFGIWLPRNSQAQARTGQRISLSGMSVAERQRTVLREGVPFASLLTLKGHVVFYVGAYKGRPAILHDMWGVRVDEPEGEDNRLIVGRIVVTSMEPGKELPNLTNRTTIGNRFHTLTILGKDR